MQATTARLAKSMIKQYVPSVLPVTTLTILMYVLNVVKDVKSVQLHKYAWRHLKVITLLIKPMGKSKNVMIAAKPVQDRLWLVSPAIVDTS